jgi:serine/threonine-protein kinase
MSREPFQFEAGQTLDGYQLLVPLAAGSASRVWVVRRRAPLEFEGLVALRIPSAPVPNPRDYERKLSLEASLASRIRHPNVAQYFELVRHQNRSCLVMEWIEGRSVAELFDEAWQTREMSIGLGVQVAIQACRALRAVHETRGFDGRALDWVHGDVSPHNLIVDTAGTLKLVDFGVAQVDDARSATENSERASFVAPEVARGERVDVRADVFSLGAVLYLLTTGWRPYPRASGSRQLAASRSDDSLILPSNLVQSYPKALENVVLRALAPHRDERFRSMTELLDELVHAFPGHASESDVAALLDDVYGEAILSDRARVDDALERYSATRTAPNTLSPSYVTTQSPERPSARPRGPGRLGLVAAALAFAAAFASTIGLSFTNLSRPSAAAAPTPTASSSAPSVDLPSAQGAPPKTAGLASTERPALVDTPFSDKRAPGQRAAPARSTSPARAIPQPVRKKATDSIFRRYGI